MRTLFRLVWPPREEAVAALLAASTVLRAVYWNVTAMRSAVKTLLPFVTGGTGFSGYTVANGVATASTSGLSEPADADINGANGTAGRTSIKPPAGPVVDPGV